MPATRFNTNLCKDIDQFLKQNPEAASCFKKGLNDKMTSIFRKYNSHAIPAGIDVGGYGYGLHANSLEMQINKGRFMPTNPEKETKMRKSMGTSPVIIGHMILQNCYQRGLGSFIDDPKIWEKAVSSSEGGEGRPSTVKQK